MRAELKAALEFLAIAEASIDNFCEAADELYIDWLDKNDPDAPVLRAVLTHLKDARAALERAKGAIP